MSPWCTEASRTHARPRLEAIDLLGLPRVPLDHLDAVERFGQARVQRPERLAHALGDRFELPQVLRHGQTVGNDVQRRDQDQRRVIGGGDDQRHDHEVGRADHQVQPGAEQVVDLAHVVRRPGHRVADRLQAVEGHALAQQAEVQLLADVALDALRRELGAEVAPELQHAAADLRAGDHQRQRADQAQVRRGAQHHVEGAPDHHRDDRRQRGVAQRADEQQDQQPPLPPHMGQHPAQRRAAIRSQCLREDELRNGHGVCGVRIPHGRFRKAPRGAATKAVL